MVPLQTSARWLGITQPRLSDDYQTMPLSTRNLAHNLAVSGVASVSAGGYVSAQAREVPRTAFFDWHGGRTSYQCEPKHYICHTPGKLDTAPV